MRSDRMSRTVRQIELASRKFKSDDRSFGRVFRTSSDALPSSWVAMIPFRAPISVLLLTAFALGMRISAAAGHESLVRQLGASSFQSRLEAERLLLEVGTESIPSLKEGLSSSNAEIRARSARLLSHLRLTAFIEQQDAITRSPWIASPEVTPAWEFFHSLVGDGPAARRTYVEMIREEPNLMLRLVHSPQTWMSAYERRCEELRIYFENRVPEPVSPNTVAALIFLGLHPDNHPSPVAVGMVNSLIGDAQFRHAIQNSETGNALKDLVRHWIRDPGKGSAGQRLTLAIQFDVDDALAAARETIAGRHLDTVSLSHLQNAVMYLARHAGLDAVEELEALLDDNMSLIRSRNAGGNRPQVDLQMRDAALLGLVLITRQEPGQFGFVNVRTDLIRTQMSLTGTTVPDEETRLAAQQRWRSWRKLHLPRAASPYDASEGILF